MSTIDLDLKYIFSIQHSLGRFKWSQRNRVANFRCPYCGDSAKNQSKARGYFYIKKDHFFYTCKNCGVGRTFFNFLKDNFSNYEQQYRLERFKNKMNIKTEEKEILLSEMKTLDDIEINNKPTKKAEIILISDLPRNHIAVEYLRSRKIPEKWMNYLQYTNDFKSYVHSHGIDRYKNLPSDQRIIIPLKDENGVMFGFQGRAIDSSFARYMTIKIDESKEKIFGIDNVDFNLPVIVTEGPFDSMFMPNSIAIVGGDISGDIKLDRTKTIFVYDNEPRSKDTVNRMLKAIDLGFSVCFWSVGIDQRYKDINDMIEKGGYTREYILKHIIKNSCSGVRARARMAIWKKI